MSLFTGLNCWDTALYIAELVFKEGKVVLSLCMTIILVSITNFYSTTAACILFYLCILVGLHQLLNSALAILGECEGRFS